MPAKPAKDPFFGEVFSLPEAAKMAGVSVRTLRLAIRSKKLRAFIIGGRSPLHSGRGMGYRIWRADLQAWYFGSDTVPKDAHSKNPFYMPPDGHPDV